MNDARRHFRPDIQGLRAVAVVLVVLDHAFHWPTGGFVGVDVFYVISGFLITSLLLRELDKSGSISLRAFYARRIRRIVPVAVLVLIVTVAISFLIWYAPRALQVFIDAVSAFFFVSNWHFIAIGTDYLQADGPASPIQHYWSLSIEEQFYAVWPLLMLLVFLIFKSKRAIAVLVVGGLVVSLFIGAYLTATTPTAAHFNTAGRAWELFAGALIAVVGVAPSRLSIQARRAVSAVGLTLILVAAVIITSSAGVPVPWVALAVIGTAAVIWADAPAGERSLLGNRMSRWLGDISYSLYLWHFPVLIFAAAVFGASGWVAAACIPVMLVLAHMSYKFVERPVLKSGFLRNVAHVTNRSRLELRDVTVGVVALVAIGVLAVAQLKGPGVLQSASAFEGRLLNVAVTAPQPGDITEPLRKEQVASAIKATTWPASVATELDRLYEKQQPTAMRMSAPGCRQNVFDNSTPHVCDLTHGASGAALLLGDSIALSWAPTVSHVAAQNDWSLRAMGFGNCSLVEIDLRNGSNSLGFADACATKREQMFDLVDREQPEIVFVSASETVMEYTDLPLTDATAAWQAGVERTIERLTDSGVDDVFVITNPPLTANPLECATRVTSPTNCLSSLSAASAEKATAEEAAVSRFDSAHLIDTKSWFCIDGSCPLFVDDHILKTDRAHLTNAAGAAVGPLMASAISRSQ